MMSMYVYTIVVHVCVYNCCACVCVVWKESVVRVVSLGCEREKSKHPSIGKIEHKSMELIQDVSKWESI